MARRPILLVEDDRDTQEVMTEWLAGYGHRVVCAASSHEAIDNLGSETPSLVIVDLYIGRINGLEILRDVRDRPRCRDVPALVLTGVHPDRVARYLREANLDLPIFTKPVDLDAFSRAVGSLCGNA